MTTARAAEFSERGYVVIPDALTPGQVRAMDAALSADLAAHAGEWADFGTFRQAVDLLPRTAAFDAAVENPRVLPLLCELLGPDVTFEELSAMVRDPEAAGGDVKGWHRDIVRDYDRRHEIKAVSVIYYLTDVTEADHCFSIVPGTHGPLLGLRPEDVTPDMAADVTAPAGSALVFHARCIHAGRLKPRSRQRRTLHLYFETAGRLRTSEWSTIPPRLARKDDPSLPPRLYSKWDEARVMDGTGRKPADAPPGAGTADLLHFVQSRANRKG